MLPESAFSPSALEITLAGERMLLHPDRALLWPARSTAVIADPHFGNDDTFRRAGIALPRDAASADLQRLTQLLRAFQCTRLVILGDFVQGQTQAGDSFLRALHRWRESQRHVVVDFVAGNGVVEPPFVFAHEPTSHLHGYVIAGQLRPVIRFGRTGAGRVPAFWQRRAAFVLPSFGSFTGGTEFTPEPGDRVYVAGPNDVLLLPPVAQPIER
jgi:metallophosphoesterase superfamily enzyme